ncbi:MAG: POT family MFS transporter [Planctomycetes bacterium]|nr:POT family MFS transporter [Planctomycetota bacterium]
MSNHTYRTAPVATTGMPPGIPNIIGNEAAERFSFYGMKAILTVFMTKFLVDAAGQLDLMSESQAKSYYHLFVASAYFFPVIGAIVADVWFGKYNTIIALSLVYCLGHLALALDETRLGLFAGLALIAIGSGGIKPCVSAHVGDQFGQSNAHLISKVFGWFYFSINFGSFFSQILTPWLLEGFPEWLVSTLSIESAEAKARWLKIGPHVAFGVPGILMLIATIIFWVGRNKYAHIPAQGTAKVFGALKGGGWKILLKLVPVYLPISVFWALYDQTGSSWVLQADKMNRDWLGHNWLASQVQAINPLLILITVPLFSYVVYPALGKVVRLTSVRKITVGLFLTVVAFSICSFAQERIDAGEHPSIAWQVAAFFVLTVAEVLVSTTGLEFSYTQAPRELKSFVMSMWLLSVSAGNVIAGFVNKFIQNDDGTLKLNGAEYFWFFTKLMVGAAVAFLIVSFFYTEKTYIQEEQAATH